MKAVAQEIKQISIDLDSLLVGHRMDHRVRKMVVDAITILRCAAEIQGKIDRHEIEFTIEIPQRRD